MLFEKFPIPSSEEKPEKKDSIEIPSEIGSKKRTEEEIEKYKKIREEIEKEKEIKEKLARGELISQQEAAFLREKEIASKKKEETKREEEIIELTEEGKEETLEENPEVREEKPEDETFFEKQKPYSLEEEQEIKEELERQADEERAKREKEKEDEDEIKRPYSPEEEKEIKEELERQADEEREKREAKKPEEVKPEQAKPEEVKPEERKGAEREKTIEEILSEKRENFVRSKLEKRETLEKDKEEYLDALKKYRADLYEKILSEIEKMGLPEKEADKLMRERAEEIFKTSIIEEANKLYDLENQIKLETKKDSAFFEKAWKAAGKAAEWYRKLPLKYKLMMSAGLFGGGIAAGAIGGATGVALATGIVTGRWFQRILGGAATAIGLEGLIKRSQEKRTEKKALKEFGNKLSEMIQKNDKKLDEKLFELVGKKKSQKIKRYIIAGSVGTFIASGLLGKAIQWGTQETGIGKAIRELWDKIGGKTEGPFEVSPKDRISTYEALTKGGKSIFVEKTEDIFSGKKIESPSFGLSEEEFYQKMKEDLPGTYKEELPGEYKTEEELPGEYISEEELAKGKDELSYEKRGLELETKEQIKELMEYNEISHVRSIGFTPAEYKAIENFKIGRLLELIPSREEAWEIWRGENSMDLMEIPHDGFYGASEFKKHIRLAELIRSYQPGPGVKDMTVKEFLQRFGPKSIYK